MSMYGLRFWMRFHTIGAWKRFWHRRRERFYSPSLIKATEDDSFNYMMGLNDGTIIEFEGAKIISREWVVLTITEEDRHNQPSGATLCIPAPRGLDVRVSEIAWVADAPHGS